MKNEVFILVCWITAVSFVVQSPVCYAASAGKSVKQGNRLYHKGNFDEALKHYNKAALSKPDSDVINFDIGTALYQKQDYEKAIEAFNKALLSDNHEIEEKAAYNIGNSKFRLGKLKENTDLASAVNLYREALDYYKRAIELNQDNTNAKYNHEFVEKELKVLLDKLKQQEKDQQQGNQQKQQQKGEEKQKQKQAQSGASEQEQKEQEQKQQAATQGEEEKEGKQEERAQEQAKGYEPEQNAQKEMSEEEARMILERYNQQDQSVGNMNRGTRERYYPPVVKDW